MFAYWLKEHLERNSDIRITIERPMTIDHRRYRQMHCIAGTIVMGHDWLWIFFFISIVDNCDCSARFRLFKLENTLLWVLSRAKLRPWTYQLLDYSKPNFTLHGEIPCRPIIDELPPLTQLAQDQVIMKHCLFQPVSRRLLHGILFFFWLCLTTSFFSLHYEWRHFWHASPLYDTGVLNRYFLNTNKSV